MKPSIKNDPKELSETDLNTAHGGILLDDELIEVKRPGPGGRPERSIFDWYGDD